MKKIQHDMTVLRRNNERLVKVLQGLTRMHCTQDMHYRDNERFMPLARNLLRSLGELE